MSESIELVEVNPVVIVIKIAEAISEGFYVNESIEGFPYLHMFPARVRLFKQDNPINRVVVAEDATEALIESYDSVTWLLQIQSLVLQGFKLVEESIAVNNFMSVKMVREVKKAVVEEPKVEVPQEEQKEQEKPKTRGRKKTEKGDKE